MIGIHLHNSVAARPSSTQNAPDERRAGSLFRSTGYFVGLVTCVLLVASPLRSQDAPLSGAQRATRAQLAGRVAEIEQRLASNDRKLDRSRNQAEIAAIKSRLQDGDFRVGNQFVVTTTTDQVRVDTASVRDSLLVAIATLPDISLKGVLRSELNDRLSQHVARFLRNATVRTNVLTRVSIVGAVARPGFFLASPDRPISELLMLAGGPTADANVNELEVTRSGRKIFSVKDSRRALKEGRTLEQIDLQSGDEVRVSARRRINWQAVIQVFLLVSTLFFAVIQFLQFYYRQQSQ